MTARKDKAGQTAVLLVLLVAGLVFLLMLCFDVFLSARAKQRLINAGDAAALAAASWQGKTLNLVGELNLAHLAAACDPSLLPVDRTNAINGANALAERLAFVGPLLGFRAANLAARRNFAANRRDGAAPQDKGMASLVEEEIRWAQAHAADVATDTWPQKGWDYANMLQTVLDGGLCTGCDNARQLACDWTGSHVYFNRAFYSSVQGRSWTWFCRYCGGHAKAISEANGFTKPSQEELGGHGRATLVNAGFFGLGLRCCDLAFSFSVDVAQNNLQYAWDAYAGGAPVNAATLAQSGVLYDAAFPWWVYAPGDTWRDWSELRVQEGGERPLVGSPRPEFDVYGAMAACRVVQDVATVSATAVTNAFPWRSAAKPFGALPDGRRVLDLFGTSTDDDALPPIVLPSFSFVRLVSLGGVGAANLYRADSVWVRHLEHLRDGMRAGGCAYCTTLNAWENGLHREAAAWLSAHPHDEVCEPPGEGGTAYDDDAFNN